MKNYKHYFRQAFVAASMVLPLGLMAQFNLTSPPTATSLNVAGLGTTEVNIDWEPDNSLMGTVTYVWHLDFPGNNFTSPIVSIPSNNSGADTELTLNLAAINGVLASQGVTIGQSANLIWTVTSTDGMTTNFAAQPFDITLSRGAVASAFDLVGPANQTALTVEGNGSNTIDINWRSSGVGVTYTWLLDAAGNDFSNPIVRVNSNNVGLDTVLTLDLATIEAVLERAGVTQGNSVNLIWRVHAYAGTDSLPSSQNFDLELTNGAVANAFDLAGPADQTALVVEGNGSNTIDINWRSAGDGVMYSWLLDAAGNDFSNPIISVNSNNMGMDTVLTLDLATIETVLEGAGVTQGNTANLIWRVHAYAGADSLPSTQNFDIELTNGAVANDFDLTFPADGFTASIANDAGQDITITWESAGEGVTYAWLLDAAGNDFSSPIIRVPSNNSGADAELTLDFATIYSVLTGAGVNPGDTANLIWRVHAYSGADSLPSQSNFGINLSPAISTSFVKTEAIEFQVYPNPVQQGNNFQLDGLNAGDKIKLIDISGKVFSIDEANGTTHSLTTNTLVPGVYVIMIESQGATAFKKITVN